MSVDAKNELQGCNFQNVFERVQWRYLYWLLLVYWRVILLHSLTEITASVQIAIINSEIQAFFREGRLVIQTNSILTFFGYFWFCDITFKTDTLLPNLWLVKWLKVLKQMQGVGNQIHVDVGLRGLLKLLPAFHASYLKLFVVLSTC